MKKIFFANLLISSLLLSGCVSYYTIPKEYAGSTAIIKETTKSLSSSKGEFFVIDEIDGIKARNSLSLTREATHGKGFYLAIDSTEHKVPTKTLNIKLLGTHETGAPIHALMSNLTGNFYSVSGNIEFTPEANHIYVVKGVLEKNNSSVWIEDEVSKERVTFMIKNND